jgi:prepilin-type N-terminal cleavage/methylation domain-containing protein
MIHPNQPVPRRSAFTLIELLVVMGIILMIGALGYAFWPASEDRQVYNAADRLQGWILIAKQRAKRDLLTTGVQFQSTDGGITYSSLVFVQQWPDYPPVPPQPQPPPTRTCTFTAPNTVNITGLAVTDFTANNTVKVGDYIEFAQGNGLYKISGVTSGTTTLTLYSNVSPQPTTYNRIIRQPRQLVGEDTMQLPLNTLIDVGQCKNIPSGGNNMLLFSPSGAMVGQGSDAKVCLWVRESQNVATPLIVAIPPRTGFIAVHPKAAAPLDPYYYTTDGRSSGM